MPTNIKNEQIFLNCFGYCLEFHNPFIVSLKKNTNNEKTCPKDPFTLPKNDYLSHLNWGTHVLMEISSNV